MKRFFAVVAAVAALPVLAPLVRGVEARASDSPESPTAPAVTRAGQHAAGRYIVVFKSGVAGPTAPKLAGPKTRDLAGLLAAAHGGELSHVYEHALQGFAARLPRGAAALLARDPRVAFVEEDLPVQADAVQSAPTWGLDRIDQHALPLDKRFGYGYDGSGVHAYIVDSGMRAAHGEFTGRVGNGKDFVGDGRGTGDCDGHGTHVAGTVGGSRYGVAKAVTLHPVRVLDCAASGLSSATAAGVDWVTANHVKPAVANLSIKSTSLAVATAVQRAVDAGVVFSISAGNDSSGSCDPDRVGNRVPLALQVGSVTSADARSSFSNYGPCVDVWAPGSSIVSAGISSNTATATKSGTSMATPHVAGLTALYLHQAGTVSPAAVQAAVLGNATVGELTGLGSGSPNRLAYSVFPGAEPLPPAEVPAPAPTITTLFSDDFETDRGWVLNPAGTDTATTGRFERGDPESTSSGYGPKQLGTTVSGVNDLVTGRLAGSTAGANDVDGGVTSMRSPSVALPASGSATLAFHFYMAHGTNSSSADSFRVFVVDDVTGTATRLLDAVGEAANDDARWTTREYPLSALAGRTVHILMVAADLSGESLVEAAVDDLRITHTTA